MVKVNFFWLVNDFFMIDPYFWKIYKKIFISTQNMFICRSMIFDQRSIMFDLWSIIFDYMFSELWSMICLRCRNTVPQFLERKLPIVQKFSNYPPQTKSGNWLVFACIGYVLQWLVLAIRSLWNCLNGIIKVSLICSPSTLIIFWLEKFRRCVDNCPLCPI